MSDMHRAGNIQPHMPVDARTRVPAAVGLKGIINFNNYYVLSFFDEAGEVVVKTCVTIRMFAEVLSVYPNIAIHIHAVKFNPKLLILADCGHGKMFAIPSDTCRKITAGAFRCCIFFKFTFDTPIVREIECPPFGIVKILLLCAVCVGLQKLPIEIHQQMLTRVPLSGPNIYRKQIY